MTGRSAPALAPPRNPTVRFVPPGQIGTMRPGATSTPHNTLSLARRAPTGTYGVVLHYPAPEGRPVRASGFALRIEQPSQTSFAFGGSVGRCQPTPPGSIVAANSEVKVLFVDRRGRLSPPVATHVQ